MTVSPVTLIGFPFGSTGRSEHLRAVWRALRTAGITAAIQEADYRSIPADPAVGELAEHIVDNPGQGIRLFHLNGDEIEAVLDRFERNWPGLFAAGHNIVYPAWELPRYPARWARLLDRFDEVWTASAFVDRAVRDVISVPVFHIPNACEPHVGTVFDRSHFGLPEDRFLVVFSFDVWSYVARKNPFAAIDAFARLVALRPSAPAHLAVKINHSSAVPWIGRAIRRAIGPFSDRATLIEADSTLDEARSLIRAADCYLSLHRSEGFGRGPAEAMFFGRPVVATGWSGNMEYMNREVSFPVRYRLVPVEPGAYPEAGGQVWAEPDPAHAAGLLARLVDDPGLCRSIGARAREHMEANFSDVALGARYRARFAEIVRAGGKVAAIAL